VIIFTTPGMSRDNSQGYKIRKTFGFIGFIEYREE